MSDIHRYAIKFLDDNGYTIGYGYGSSTKKYLDGEIIDLGVQTVKIDFELSPTTSTAGHLVLII